MKLKILAEAAAEFYETPALHPRSRPEETKTIRARHVCQWLACDAGYSKSAVARFWNVDPSSIFYSCKIVRDQINDPAWQRELREFMELVKKRLNKN